jgi:hypothetical protein
LLPEEGDELVLYCFDLELFEIRVDALEFGNASLQDGFIEVFGVELHRVYEIRECCFGTIGVLVGSDMDKVDEFIFQFAKIFHKFLSQIVVL